MFTRCKTILACLIASASVAIAQVPPYVIVPQSDGSERRYVPETQPATVPVVPPVTPPVPPVVPPVPPADPNVILVSPGQSWVQAVRSARAGQTVRLATGEWKEALTDTTIRANGVRIEGAGRGLTTIRVAKGGALICWCWDGTTISGIRFVSDAPTQTGVALWGCHRVTISGCEVSGFTMGITAQVATGRGSSRRGQGNTIVGCLIRENYNPAKRADGLSADSSGMFAAGQDGLTITRCTFDSNGWKGTAHPGSERNHNVYLAGDNGPATVTDNVTARASSHGMQVRCGGTVANNTFIDNPIHLSYGLVNGGGPLVPGGVTGPVTGNVFCGSRLLAGKPRGYAAEFSNCRDVLIGNNTFAGDHADSPGGVAVAAIKLDVCALSETSAWKGKQIAIGKAVLIGNAVTWPGGPLWQHPKVDRSKVTSQQAWPAVDVAAVRASAAARLADGIREAAK